MGFAIGMEEENFRSKQFGECHIRLRQTAGLPAPVK